MATLEDLRETYERFLAFGSNRNLSSLENLTLGSSCTMDGAKWAKFCRDSGIIDGKSITSTGNIFLYTQHIVNIRYTLDIDIIFNKVKGKGSRRIDSSTFVEAVEMLSQMKYSSRAPSDAFSTLLYDICIKSNGPSNKSSVVS